MEKTYSMQEMLKMYPLTQKQIKSEVKKGNLKAKIVGFTYMFTENHVNEWLNTPSEPLTKAPPKAGAKPKGRPAAKEKEEEKISSRHPRVYNTKKPE